METTPAHRTLQQFRQGVYRALGQRADALFELLEAALEAAGPATLVRLSLEPAFRRRWPSAPDALADGTLAVERGRALVGAALAEQALDRRAVWALDGTVWPRPAAKTSAARTYAHRPRPGIPQHGLVPGWEYQWLVAVPEDRGSWVLPLDVTRRGPAAGTPAALAIAQLRRALRGRRAAPRPVVTFDSQYDPVQLARAALPADLLVRLTPKRRFYRAPLPYSGKGTRVRRHGPIFKTWDATTHGPPDRSAEVDDPEHGRVHVAAWTNLHVQGAHEVPFTVLQVRVEHLPKSGRTPDPLWLAWVGQALPADLPEVWHWYRRRFVIEHGFRFLKQELGWTRVRPADPPAGDRPPPALGASGRPHAAVPGPGAAGRRRTSGAAGQPDPSAPPTRECPRTAPRRAARAAATLPGRPPTQEAGSLNPGRPAFWPSASPPRPLGSHHLVQTPNPERSEGSGELLKATRSFTPFRMTGVVQDDNPAWASL